MSEEPPPPAPPTRSARGRGSALNPANRFERLRFEEDVEALAERVAAAGGAGGDDPVSEDEVLAPRVGTQFYRDESQSVLSKNDSPDLGFEISLNPYRGCEHGCAYCYARPYHEYLGWSCGVDFESKIMVKEDAPELLRKELGKPGYRPTPMALSGATDCYQPVERKLEITRRCLEVLAEARHPLTVVTKNALVTRDIDHLSELAAHGAVRVCLSVTTLDRELAAKLEPRASSPRARLGAVRTLTEAGIPAGVMVAPIIPTLNEPEIDAVLGAAAEAGASFAGYTVLRLPWQVESVFGAWLEEHFPGRREAVMKRIGALQGERNSHGEFGKRLRGDGVHADLIAQMFRASCKRHALNRGRQPPLNTAAFRRPPGAQLELGI